MTACDDGACIVNALCRDIKRKEYNHELTKIHEMLQGLSDDISSISNQYCEKNADIAGIEGLLHDLWDEFIHLAKIIPSSSFKHDRIVTIILSAQNIGRLMSHTKNNDVDDLCRASVFANSQKLWEDLPYLANDLQDFWAKDSDLISTAERQSLAAFTAKLCSSGVCTADLAGCALWLFSTTLEVKRPHTSPSASVCDDFPLSMPELLPSCLEWLAYANFSLAKICGEGYTTTPFWERSQRPQVPDSQYTSSSVIPSCKFSLSRWVFWRRRFGQLYMNGDKEISQAARKCFEIMVSTGRLVGIDIPGEKQYLARIFRALDEELAARGKKGSVGPEDIIIDLNWADEEIERQTLE